jgi:hypothetical protein
MTTRINSRELYYRMKRETDFSPIRDTASREYPDASSDKIAKWLDAFLQWFSLIPNLEPGERIQMLRTVDRIWHAFVLNTKFYRDFCNRYIGCFVDHNPLDAEGDNLTKKAYAQRTLDLLEEQFGNETNEALLFLHEEWTCCMGCGDSFPTRIEIEENALV